MELGSTWSPSWAHPTGSWLARGPGAILDKRGVLLTANQSGKSISALLPPEGQVLMSQLGFCKQDPFPGLSCGTLTSEETDSCLKTQNQLANTGHVELSQENPLSLPGAVPENEGYPSSMRIRQEAPSLTAPTSPLLHSTPPISPSK